MDSCRPLVEQTREGRGIAGRLPRWCYSFREGVYNILADDEATLVERMESALALGILGDGTPVDGPIALREALLANPDVFAGTVTEKLMIYALGRGLEPAPVPA